jgi:polyvinyl alcohol dehydrogenase (cytochrome)
VIDARTGLELWRYDSLREFQTLNGVVAKGGSFDAVSIVGVNGLVLAGSGYGMFGQAPGNALLAFRPKK